MRKRKILYATLLFSLVPTAASASLNGKEDFSEPRIVAISVNSEIGSNPWANGSGYLYSSRIVFSAGHIKDHDEFSQIYVAQPNQKLIPGMNLTKVVKKIFPESYKTKIYKDDFAILILEKPLRNIEPAPLITPELLSQVFTSKTPMKITGYGAYQDVCLETKATPPCQFGSDRTSLVPRSILATPLNSAEVLQKYGRSDAEVADHVFLTGPYKSGGCPGDSGGSTTTMINDVSYYVGTTPSGHWNGYACGQSGGTVGDTIGYTAPVFKFLELIQEAEKYVATHPYIEKVTPSPSKSPSTVATKPQVPTNLEYVFQLARKWASASRAEDTALKQCTSARDKGVVLLHGKVSSVGAQIASLKRDLNRYPGFNACLAGFLK